MARTIWKFPLNITDYQEIDMPDGTPLYVAVHGVEPYLWAEVDPKSEMSTIGIWIVGTGHDLPSMRGDYIGSFMMLDGDLVFHVYGPTML